MRVVVLAILMGVLGGATAARAAGDADAAKPIVAEYCAACHEVPGYQPKDGIEALDVPALQAFANDPATYDAERLRTFLRQPHFPMEGLVLSDRDIANLVAFIEGLHTP